MSRIGNHVVGLYEQPLVAECRTCSGTGEVYASHDCMKDCNVCKGEGEIQCDTGGLNCPFEGYCYCEAAWERQEEDRSSWG